MDNPNPKTTSTRLVAKPGDRLAQIFEDFYVDLDLVRAERGLDPVAALIGRGDSSELLKVFHQLADRHTLLSLSNRFPLLATNGAAASHPRPENLIGAARHGVARLPIRIERSTTSARERFWITRVDADAPIELQAGHEVTHWNGVPIAIAAELQGRTLRGGHSAARQALGLRSLPQRLVGTTLLPNEDWAILTCRDDDQSHEVRLDWKSEPVAPQPASEQATWRKVLRRTTSGDGFRCGLLKAVAKQELGGQEPAYIRLFNLPEWSQLARLVEWLRSVNTSRTPRDLVLDLRGNPGGSVETADHLVRLLGSDQGGPHEPTQFQFRNTQAIRRTLGAHPQWRHCVEPHDEHTLAPHPMTCPASLRDIQPLAVGSTVIIVDALTYSAAEILVAQLRRSPRTTVVGPDPCTGGGTAGAWSFHTLRHLNGPHVMPPLPQRLELQIAVRRAVLNDGSQWAPIPLYQVDHLVPISKQGLLHGNCDLLQHAAQFLRRDDAVSPRAQNPKQNDSTLPVEQKETAA